MRAIYLLICTEFLRISSCLIFHVSTFSFTFIEKDGYFSCLSFVFVGGTRKGLPYMLMGLGLFQFFNLFTLKYIYGE